MSKRKNEIEPLLSIIKKTLYSSLATAFGFFAINIYNFQYLKNPSPALTSFADFIGLISIISFIVCLFVRHLVLIKDLSKVFNDQELGMWIWIDSMIGFFGVLGLMLYKLNKDKIVDYEFYWTINYIIFCIGVLAFLYMIVGAFFSSKGVKNFSMKIPFLIKVISILLLLSGILGTSTNIRAYFNSQVPLVNNTTNVVPTINKLPDQKVLYDLVQKWRSDNKYPIYEENTELCVIANELIPKLKLNFSVNTLKEYRSNYQISSLISNAYTFEKDILDNWSRSNTTLEILKAKNSYACIRCSETYCIGVLSNLYTPKPVVNNTVFTCLSDKCGNKQMTENECNNSVCCEVGKKWSWYSSKESCNKAQDKYWDEKYEDDSDDYDYDFPKYEYTPPTYINSQITSTPSETTVDRSKEIAKCKNEVNSKYDRLVINCSVLYGSTSAEEACIVAQNKERIKDLAECK